ncbi:MAG: zinc-binding alcohol dehydrogenase [Pseudomonadota bacterium]
MADTARALVYVAPQCAKIEDVALEPLREGWVEVATQYSALSRGTERLVFEGRVPESEWAQMRAPFQVGAFPFPVRYGYAAVGTVEAGPEALIGRSVFALAPHQTRLRLPVAAVHPLPEGVPAARAVLGANAETALNALWDAAPKPGSRVLVVGAGLLGCLIAAFLSRRSDLDVAVVDPIPERAAALDDFSVKFFHPSETPSEYDIAFHTSATAAGLETALSALAFEGRVIELSWYGDARVAVALGGAFHSRRLAIVSSQVGHVAPARRASTTHSDRLSQALASLDDPRIDVFLSQEVGFEALPEALPRVLGADAPGIATRIRYNP